MFLGGFRGQWGLERAVCCGGSSVHLIEKLSQILSVDIIHLVSARFLNFTFDFSTGNRRINGIGIGIGIGIGRIILRDLDAQACPAHILEL